MCSTIRCTQPAAWDKIVNSGILAKPNWDWKPAPLQHSIHEACSGNVVFIKMGFSPEGARLTKHRSAGLRRAEIGSLDHTVANASRSCHRRIHLLTQKVPPLNQPRYILDERIMPRAWKVAPRFPSLRGNRFSLKFHPGERNLPGASPRLMNSCAWRRKGGSF